MCRRRWGLALVGAMMVVACGAGDMHYVRDTEVPELDSYTMSLGFDRKDIERLWAANAKKLMRSRVAKTWERKAAMDAHPPSVAIYPIVNTTDHALDEQLDTLLSKFETDLVNGTAADVVSLERQPQMIAEVRRQQRDAFNPARVAKWGRQVGVQYVVTGKLMDNVEFQGAEERVQYSMFVQVIEVETSIVKFQNEADITKAKLN